MIFTETASKVQSSVSKPSTHRVSHPMRHKMAAPAPHAGLSADALRAYAVAADEHVECLGAARTTRCSLKQLDARVVEILVAHGPVTLDGHTFTEKKGVRCKGV